MIGVLTIEIEKNLEGNSMNGIETIGLLCSEIENELTVYGDYVSNNLMDKTCKLFSFVSTAPIEYKVAVEERLLGFVSRVQKYSKVWLYSVIIKLTYNSNVLEEFLEYIIKEKEFSVNIKYFLYYQIKNIVFRYINLDSSNIKYLQWKLLKQVIELFQAEMADVLMPISEKERNKDMVLVLTEQILVEQHGPTKIAFDRCKILMEEMGKKVLLINTAEILSQVGRIPYYDCRSGKYANENLTKEILEWKGTRISYFQCENNMPNRNDLRILLQTVRNIKPDLVIAVGGSGVLINLIDTMIPVLCVGLGPADLEVTMVTCQTLSRPLKEKDKELLAKIGKEERSVIQSIFTSSLQPQGIKVTRAELGLPDDKFIIVIVGYRLDTDINEEFMKMLSEVVDSNTVVALIGQFESYENYMLKIPKLRDKVYLLGLTNDILAWIEVCDLYVNPHRKGGGTSGVEALFQGLPVVTTSYGDVAVNVGEDFWTESYKTMPDLIRRYRNDMDFYNEMSAKAKARAEILLDTAGEFKNIIREFEWRTKGEPENKTSDI